MTPTRYEGRVVSHVGESAASVELRRQSIGVESPARAATRVPSPGSEVRERPSPRAGFWFVSPGRP